MDGMYVRLPSIGDIGVAGSLIKPKHILSEKPSGTKLLYKA
jgi:hypothetical protein